MRNSRLISLFVTLMLVLVQALTACNPGKNTQPLPTTPPVSQAITDTPGELPDLAVAGMVLQNAAGSSQEEICKPATWPQYLLISIVNRGRQAAGAFIVQVNDVWQPVTAGLPAGQTIALLFSVHTELVSVTIDPDLLIPESDETNNHAYQELSLPSMPDVCLATPAVTIPTIQPWMVMTGHSAGVLSVSFSPDGRLVASGSIDNTLRLWQVQQGKLLRTMRGHPFPIMSLAFSPNGSLLATGSTDSILRVWRVSDGSLLRTLKGHAGWLTSLDFSADGRHLVSSAQDFTVRIWRVADGQIVEIIDEGMSQVNGVAFAPDSQSIAWCESNGTVRLRSLSGEWLHTLKETSSAATSLAYSPTGDQLAVGHSDGTIRIWNTEQGNLLQTVKSHTRPITAILYSPDGKWLASASQDSSLRLWQIVEGGLQNTPAWIFSGHSGPVNSAVFSPDSTLLASGSDDGNICLWEIPPISEGSE